MCSYASGSVAEEHRKTNYVQKIDRALLGWTGAQEPTGAWSKGALTTTICQFLEHFCDVRNVEASSDERKRLVASYLQIRNNFVLEDCQFLAVVFHYVFLIYLCAGVENIERQVQ